MFHLSQAEEKPCITGILAHSIITTDKLKKYNNNTDISTNLTSGKTERIINLFIA
ncbi:MAG: hypothetical protein FWD71_08860 [Oscillospiraceae bacterium]|nr:hypothetical protein [Oscillospiraceae bacterium]